jgi:acetolactate synthase-1/2/3 large subunit
VLIEKPENNVEIVIKNNGIFINTEKLHDNSIIIRPQSDKPKEEEKNSKSLEIVVKNNFAFRFIDPEKMEDNSTPIKPQRLMKEIRDNTPDNTIFLADSGSHWAWAMHYLPVYPGGNFFPTLSLGSMGASVCSVMGVQLALPEQPVVCICGDGSFLMNGNEMATASQFNIPAIWVILNDSRFSMPAVSSEKIYKRTIGVHFNKTNFVKWAEAYDIKGYTVEKPGELPAMLTEAIASKKPAIFDVYIDKNEIPPVGNRLRYGK